jgi:hypothetical protein
MAEVIFMMVLLAAGWFWLDSMRVRELALAVVKQFCTQQGLQLLDGAVAFASIKLERDSQGRLAFARTYRFEFSDNGENRLSGMLTMLDKQPGPMHVEAFNTHAGQ